MSEPSEEEIYQRGRKIFEFEKRKSTYWDDAPHRNGKTGDDTPINLCDEGRQPYLDRARAKLIKEREG